MWRSLCACVPTSQLHSPSARVQGESLQESVLENPPELQRVSLCVMQCRNEPVFLRVLRKSQPHPLIVVGGFTLLFSEECFLPFRPNQPSDNCFKMLSVWSHNIYIFFEIAETTSWWPYALTARGRSWTKCIHHHHPWAEFEFKAFSFFL